jgi:hypothetical protein
MDGVVKRLAQAFREFYGHDIPMLQPPIHQVLQAKVERTPCMRPPMMYLQLNC